MVPYLVNKTEVICLRETNGIKQKREKFLFFCKSKEIIPEWKKSLKIPKG